MKFHHRHHPRGFTLTELAIVLGVFGLIIASLWSLVSINRQRVGVSNRWTPLPNRRCGALTVRQSGIDCRHKGFLVSALTNNGVFSRILCAVLPQLAMGGPVIMPKARGWQRPPMLAEHFAPARGNISRPQKCGSPAVTTGQQYFAIEFTQLDFGSCVAVAAGIYPTHPAGLVDVYINASTASSGVMESTNPQLPAPTSWAETNCTNGSNANVIDFVYRLRPPCRDRYPILTLRCKTAIGAVRSGAVVKRVRSSAESITFTR